ncbi:hypothetical protein OOT46_03045 [Aquabacterium sp. A7-Y]|uniref:hypothetical protein n=1 Tax=Aquabacterium sp. A7-Y TaxID=1349605 RepID=UPI00223D34F7|nr:hypothetical protein [Aquabacterium sp. A7-Y]MCW7536830.1 hypothetical protein [Aquabacterium sp. A7-Y]
MGDGNKLPQSQVTFYVSHADAEPTWRTLQRYLDEQGFAQAAVADRSRAQSASTALKEAEYTSTADGGVAMMLSDLPGAPGLRISVIHFD